MELWRDIPGYEGIYQASNMGGIRTCEGKTTYTELRGVRRWKQRSLKQKLAPNTKGRIDPRVCLWKNGEVKTWLVSRLVGLAWCDGYSGGMTINHINGDPLDNRAENLEWVSRTENIQKGFEIGLYASIQKPVQLISENEVMCFSSMAEASRCIGRNQGYISGCIKANKQITSSDGKVFSATLQ